MNEQILNANGTLTIVGDAGSVAGIIAKRVAAATTPATYDAEGNETAPAIVPNAADVAVEVTNEELKTHDWRLPAARAERLENLRALRNEKLKDLDIEAIKAWENGDNPIKIGKKKKALRDLPPKIKTYLKKLDNTDKINEYTPNILKD